MEPVMSIRKTRPAQRGFTLIELIIVLIIIMVVSAAAVPQLMRTIAAVRVRSSADTVAGLIQKIRQQAVKDNKFYTGITQNLGISTKLCVDLNWNGNCDVTEFSVGLANFMTLAAAPPDTSLITCGPLGPTLCPAGYPPGLNYVPEPQVVLPSYSARGLPCVGKVPATPPKWPLEQCLQTDPNSLLPVGFLYVLQYQNTQSFSAIAVTPAGRVTTWTYNGIDGNGRAVWQQ